MRFLVFAERIRMNALSSRPLSTIIAWRSVDAAAVTRQLTKVSPPSTTIVWPVMKPHCIRKI
jgi:hypothetical protein